jgi:hypothetical protein
MMSTHIHTKDNLRRRFGNALRWFTALVNVSEARVTAYICNLQQFPDMPVDGFNVGKHARLLDPEQVLDYWCQSFRSGSS